MTECVFCLNVAGLLCIMLSFYSWSLGGAINLPESVSWLVTPKLEKLVFHQTFLIPCYNFNFFCISPVSGRGCEYVARL